jgi:reactive intermediate/imine deaminase
VSFAIHGVRDSPVAYNARMPSMCSAAAALATALSVAVAFATGPSDVAMQMPGKQLVMAGPAPVGPYTPAVKAGGLIYISGTLAQDDAGALVGPGDVAAQTRRVLERMDEVLRAAGSSLAQVASVTVYLTSADHFQAMNDVYRTYWPTDPPARTTVLSNFVLPGALVEMSMIAVAAGGERVVVHPEDWKASPNPYSYGIRAGDTLFLSGLVSRDGRRNSVVTGDITAQTKVVMENAGEILRAAGMGYEHVVSSRVYLPDTAVFQQMNEAYRPYFPTDPPARATVGAGLAGSEYAVEITMVASRAPREVIRGGRPANPNLSPAIRAGRTLYLSGMLGNTGETKGDIEAQTRETLDRLKGILAAAGYAAADVVDSMVYLTDLSTFGAMNSEYRSFFGGDFPARTTLRAGLVAPDGLVEIMMTAVKP